jgi:hypothetical protein
VLQRVQQCGDALFLHDKCSVDAEIVLAAAHAVHSETFLSRLQDFAPEYCSNKDVVLSAVRQHSHAIEDAPPELQVCREVFLVGGEDFFLDSDDLQTCASRSRIPLDLQRDKTFLLSLVCVNPRVFLSVLDWHAGDKSFFNACLEANPGIEAYLAHGFDYEDGTGIVFTRKQQEETILKKFGPALSAAKWYMRHAGMVNYYQNRPVQDC